MRYRLWFIKKPQHAKMKINIIQGVSNYKDQIVAKLSELIIRIKRLTSKRRQSLKKFKKNQKIRKKMECFYKFHCTKCWNIYTVMPNDQ